jgi:hypothetical protein
MPGISMPPAVWGPIFWHTIHIVALGYSKTPNYSEKKAAKEFYESLAFVIPCPVCREHYAQHLKENPLTPNLDSREDLFNWTVMIHNKVNKDLGKPEVSPLEAIQWFQTLGARSRSPLYSKQDQEALELSSFLKGVGTATAVLGGVYGLYMLYRHNVA